MPAPLVLEVLRPSVQPDTRALLGSSLAGVAGVLLDLARPWPLAIALDYAIGGRDLLGLPDAVVLALAGVALLALTAVSGLADMQAAVAAERAAERVGARVRARVFEHAIELSLRWHDRMRSGELMSRLTTDVGRLLDVLVAWCSTLLPDVVRLGLVLLVLFVLNPALALVALAVVPLLFALSVRQRRRVRAAETQARAQAGRFAGTATDLIRNVRAVQAFGRAARARDTFARHAGEMRDANQHAAITEERCTPIADVVLALGAGAVLVVGGTEALHGTLSAGDLVVAMSYVSALYSPVRGLSRLSGVVAKATASAGRIAEVLSCADRVTERPDAQQMPAVREGIRFRDVRFGYDPDRPVLDGFELTVRAGETVCLFGPSGAGKSTVLNLLLRLYDVDSGAVLIDGVDVRDVRLAGLRHSIAYVPQDPWLLDDSIAQNIAFGSVEASRHAILAAGRAALVDEFAQRLPDGYDSSIGEGGALLSGGQRRRVALARAVLSHAPIVVLDEPTASLDHASAAAVTDAIRRTRAGRTTVIVTHDRELAALAHRVVTLDHPARVTRKEVTRNDRQAHREGCSHPQRALAQPFAQPLP